MNGSGLKTGAEQYVSACLLQTDWQTSEGHPFNLEVIATTTSGGFSSAAAVTALQPFERHVDSFATRHDGSVMSTFFEGWREWFEIRPETGIRSGATVTPLLPFKGHVDLFVISDNHTAMSTFFEADGGWREWFEIHRKQHWP